MTRRLAIALPAALLLTIALTQMTLARTADLSPWKGGGFGMFAAIDQPGNRIIAIRVEDEHGRRAVARLLPDTTYGGALSARARLRTRTAPSPRHVQMLADQIAVSPLRSAEPWPAQASPRLKASRYYSALQAALPASPHVEILDAPRRSERDTVPRAVSAEILHFRFDPATYEVRLVTLQAPASARGPRR